MGTSLCPGRFYGSRELKLASAPPLLLREPEAVVDDAAAEVRALLLLVIPAYIHVRTYSQLKAKQK